MKPTLVTCALAMTVVSAWAIGQSLSPETMRKRTQTLSNAKQVATAALMYAGDYDDVLPIGKSMGQVQKVMMPYMRSASIWKSENPGSRLLFNMNVAGVGMTTFALPSQIPMIYESKAWPDGAKVIAYVDGHARMETKKKLPAIEAMLKKKWPKGRVLRRGR